MRLSRVCRANFRITLTSSGPSAFERRTVTRAGGEQPFRSARPFAAVAEVTDQIVTDRVMNELMGRDASARRRSYGARR
jgi:hypothetical protein